MDIIRLKKEDEQIPAPAVRKSPSVRKLVVRLLPGINEHLRSAMRYRGDLSAMVIDAIHSVNLESVRLVDLAGDSRLGTTTIALPPPLHARIKAVAKARNASMNEMVNTAIAHWLATKNVIRLL